MIASTKLLHKTILNRGILLSRHIGSISTGILALQGNDVHTTQNWNRLVVSPTANVNKVSGALFISYFSTNMAVNPIATYEEVKDLPNHPEKLLIDVREPSELQQTGVIPTSINIPLGDVATAFSNSTSPSEFKELYGRPKPEQGDYLILSCRSGRRSQLAIDILEQLGYTNARNYKGSWTEWAQKEGLPY
ncbi:rhodanese domain-containing protein CG4456 isoform X1 [Culicoides brevitarsis]|uniref:rhodanese domain-containing protein CG4456 isoform X1 n=1 Tax=Culicoides brevitarsis TaxID=469753 RepID=UPI00307C5191